MVRNHGIAKSSGMKPILCRWLLSSGSWNAIMWENTARYSKRIKKKRRYFDQYYLWRVFYIYMFIRIMIKCITLISSSHLCTEFIRISTPFEYFYHSNSCLCTSIYPRNLDRASVKINCALSLVVNGQLFSTQDNNESDWTKLEKEWPKTMRCARWGSFRN